MSDWSFETAARTLYQEVRGEPLDGQQAVAHVICNRLATSRWGHSLASVCLWPKQFSGWNGPSDPNFLKALELSETDNTLDHMRSVMQAALDRKMDPTGGATHYHAKSIPAPYWAAGAISCGQFGHQLFYKGVK